MILHRVGCCLSCIVAVLATRNHMRGRGRNESLQPTSSVAGDETLSKQWVSTAGCVKSTEGMCGSSTSGTPCEQRFGSTQCMDFQCICSPGMCANTSGICTRLVSRQLGIHAIRSLNSAPGVKPKFIGVEFGFRAFGPFWDPAWLKNGPDFYLALVDSPEPQWLVTDIGDGFVRLESTIAPGKVLSFTSDGVQIRDVNKSKAIHIGFKVQGGPDVYELVYHRGWFISKTWRLFGRVRSSWMVVAIWLCPLVAVLVAVVGGTSCCAHDFFLRLMVYTLIPFLLIWLLVFLHFLVPAAGVSYCGGHDKVYQCSGQQQIRFEPALEESIVDHDGIWARPKIIDVERETARKASRGSLLPWLLLFMFCFVFPLLLSRRRRGD